MALQTDRLVNFARKTDLVIDWSGPGGMIKLVKTRDQNVDRLLSGAGRMMQH